MKEANGAQPFSAATLARDLRAGTVVFLVALPLCLGIALASRATGIADDVNVNAFAGLLAGIVGGIVVGLLSGSHTSVSGPAAGLTAIVASQLAALGNFQTFLLAVVIAGFLQIGLGWLRAGALAAFCPSSVINGLLAAIGVILILKQAPHLLGHDADPEGEMAFIQPDHENTLTEILALADDMHKGAAVVGLLSLAILLLGGRWKPLKNFPIPLPLVVTLLGVALNAWFHRLGNGWPILDRHLVAVPMADSVAGLVGFLQLPDFSQWTNLSVYGAALTIAIVASLETVLNLDAVDRLDPYRRNSPPSRELVAQGVGNILAGMVGGLPMTSVIVRGSVNVHSGAQTRLSAVFHGVLILLSVAFLPHWLNAIPLSALAAILLATGLKLARPSLFAEIWNQGRYQFAPFIITLLAIVFTDLLVGVLIGLGVSLAFILNSNLRRPIRRVIEKHVGGEVLKIELANQVSFLNRAALMGVLDNIPRGKHVLFDATHSDYIDPDILNLIREYKETEGPARGVQVSTRGFRTKYQLHDEILFADYSTRELQTQITPAQVLALLRDGNERFRSGNRLNYDFSRQLGAAASGQHPLAVVLSCIDSRTPAELIFDLGLGDVFSVRIAGNVISPKVLGSIEYGCAVAGSKLVVVVGHTLCGAVTASIRLTAAESDAAAATGCQHIESIVEEIRASIGDAERRRFPHAATVEQDKIVDEVTRRNVLHSVRQIVGSSQTIARLVAEERIAVIGAMYDVASGRIDFLGDQSYGPLGPSDALGPDDLDEADDRVNVAKDGAKDGDGKSFAAVRRAR